MNILSKLLDIDASEKIFQFHPKCRKVNLTHLCFVDDLLIFCKGNLDLIVGVKCVLERFYELSGLRLNASKTEIFIAGVNGNQKALVHEVTGFKIGCLPVRYLGVPLVPRKLTEKDCVNLVEKIKAKLGLWSNRWLSYTGRLQLVKAVLFSIANFWWRQLILPAAVVKRVDQLCVRFFWNGGDVPAKGDRVSWEVICTFKSEGGLGLKNLKSWNKACIILLVKEIFAAEGSLWVAWVRTCVLKGADFLSMECKASFSWSLRKILKAREEVYPLFVGITDWGKVNARWLWQGLRGRKEKVGWQKIVWFPMHIPKHSLIAWMTVLDRLPTDDRLIRLRIEVNDKCRLCDVVCETRSHIFFECPFSKAVWEGVMRLCSIDRPVGNWEEEMDWAISRFRGKTLYSFILRLAWCGYIYCIWEERNHRQFRKIHRGTDVVIN
ncbi:uncharacterized protein LOC120130429 [Hibiscus syriacus]|uniref:uncharacterized protein LOC120130429 n=1 Tax=Hibiscus syriacus TaxID=106335 RepID=UPI001922C897|nr:uncharacterized protein LOC120130429 [Hibiscus syriacus]